MSWPLLFESFLARSLVGGLAISLVGVAVASVLRQPARKIRVLELTIVACLITPFLPLLPGLPRWEILPETMVRPRVASVSSVPIEPTPALPAVTSTSAEPEPRIMVEAPQQRPPLLMSTILWDQYILVIYLGIACCFALRWMVGLVALARLIRASRSAPESLRERLVEVAGPGANRLQLRLSDRIEQPIAASVLRPTILIPQGLVADGRPIPNSMDGVALKDLARDVKEVTVRVYRSPKVVVKFTTRDGVPPKDLKVDAHYDGDRPSIRFIRPAMALKGIAAETDRMALRRLDDGRLQLSSIVPGLPVTISASAEGFRPAEVKATLAEGESKDVDLILERQ